MTAAVTAAAATAACEVEAGLAELERHGVARLGSVDADLLARLRAVAAGPPLNVVELSGGREERFFKAAADASWPWHAPLKQRMGLRFLYLSTVPAAPCGGGRLRARDQPWHTDHVGDAAIGVTVVVYLTDVTDDNGPTEFKPTPKPTRRSGSGATSTAAAPLRLPGPAGSIIAYKTDVVHRGCGNRSSETRTVAFFIYESPTSLPPYDWVEWPVDPDDDDA